MQYSVYLLLGSNLGDSISILDSATGFIQNSIGKLSKASSIYRTEPWKMKTNQWFFNQVLEISSSLGPEELLTEILSIEKQLGRTRRSGKNSTYESRTIDIDILYFDSLVFNSDMLTIPHPRIQERKFVLAPMCEIAPLFEHPFLLQNQKSLLTNCKDISNIERL